MEKYIDTMIRLLYLLLVIDTRSSTASTYTVCDRAIRLMFWNLTNTECDSGYCQPNENNVDRGDITFSKVDNIHRQTHWDVIRCLNEFEYKPTDFCISKRCPPIQICYRPFEYRWEINHKGRNSSDDCFVVGTCDVYLEDFGGSSITCNRTTSDSNELSKCSTQYCNSKGQCVLNRDYNLLCNCSTDYYGETCSQAKESDTTAHMAIAVVSSSTTGILLMLAVMCVCRLRSRGKLCFRKQKEPNEVTLEGASNSVAMKMIQHSKKKQSNDSNTDIACDMTEVACDSVPGVTQRDPIYSGSDSEI